MKQALKYTVFLSSESQKKDKPVFSRVIWSDDSVSPDFSSLFSSFRYLFGTSCIIMVEIQNVA